MLATVKMSEYIAMKSGHTVVRTVYGVNRAGRPEAAQQRDVIPGTNPVGVSIEPFDVQRRGNRLLARGYEHPDDLPIHFVRVYADSTEERI